MRKIGSNGFKRGYEIEKTDWFEYYDEPSSFGDYDFDHFFHVVVSKTDNAMCADFTAEFSSDEGVDEFMEFLDKLREDAKYFEDEYLYGGIHLDLTNCYDLTEIPDDAFKGIKGVKSVLLPAYLERIGDRAFCESSVEDIEFTEGGDDLESIGEEAFAYSELKYITPFSDKVKVGKDAFKGCPTESYIEKTTETENFTSDLSAAQSIFNGTTSGSVIKINDPSDSPGLAIGYVLRACCWSKITLDLSESKYKEIPDGTFEYCDSLYGIILPECLEKIGRSAFEHCNNLKEIKIPSTVTKMWGAFGDCKNLKTVDVSENPNFINKDGYILTSDGEGLILCLDGTNNIPEGVTCIGSYSCVGNYPINPVFPEGVTDIGEGAFMFAEIESITFPKSLKRIEEFAFHACDKFTVINYPEDIELEEVQQYAFDLINEDIIVDWHEDYTEEDGIRIKFFELEDVDWDTWSRKMEIVEPYYDRRFWDVDREDK